MSLGTETRTSILPVSSPSSDYLGPSYDYADELPMPNEVGVRPGGNLSDVTDAVKGVAYYADMIGYGEASNFLTRSMGNKPFPMGINYFVKTGSRCSNGSDMWVYVNGIPKGDGLGQTAQRAMKAAGLPSLRGLAPGILEDAEAALNPAPIVDAVFGTGYVKCKSVKMPVGDAKGRIKGRDGKEWIQPLYPGDIQYDGSTPTQTRWVLDRQIRQEEFNAEEKVFCPDGTKTASHQDRDCKKPMLAGFVGDIDIDTTAETTVPVVLVLFTLTALYLRFRNV
jgi:hypothetical protein